ncbi:hypothetical protein [Hornefia butyriciproducens]|uniref:hypothetical protein n=1 Tax=Hornefia butyriciproducens TaxID=2652293 RepID=UPI003F899375
MIGCFAEDQIRMMMEHLGIESTELDIADKLCSALLYATDIGLALIIDPSKICNYVSA